MNCTSLSKEIPLTKSAHFQQPSLRPNSDNLKVKKRNQAYEFAKWGDLIPEDWLESVAAANAFLLDHLQRYYPMYVVNKKDKLTANLDSGYKSVHGIKLLGYSLTAKRHPGVIHGHEMTGDDYLIMRIKEIDGKVVSNNRHAHGAFAVLYAGNTSHNENGSIEYHRFDEQNGIVVQEFQPTLVSKLTIEILDRFGKPAHFGGMHLWFKLLASHG